MDAIDSVLDCIEKLLQKISDKNVYRQLLYEKYNNYRTMFEKDPKNPNLPYFVTKYLADLELYVKGTVNKAPIEEYSPIYSIYNNDEYNEDYNNLNDYTDILSGNLDEISTSNDVEKVKTLTNHIQEEYVNLNIRKQALDQKICSALFKLMMLYIKEGNYEDAKSTASKFGLDMRLYLVRYMKTKLRDFKEAKNYKDAELAWKYIYSNDHLSKNDLELWKYIYKLEYPDLETSENNLPIEVKKHVGLLEAISIKIRAFLDKMEFIDSLAVKTIVIRNDKDVINAQKACMMSKSRSIDRRKNDVILEYKKTFATIILNTSINKTQLSHLIGVKIPNTAKKINNYCFYNCTQLKTIDLFGTKVTQIRTICFFKFWIRVNQLFK